MSDDIDLSFLDMFTGGENDNNATEPVTEAEVEEPELESKKELDTARAELMKLEADNSVAATQNELTELDREERELRRKLEALSDRRNQLRESRYDQQAKLRSLKALVADASQRYEVDLKNKEHADNLARERSSILEDCKDFAWNADAKPFQIDGAVYAAIAKRCIIADAMGLGKTIESIMYCDMVKSKKALVICPGEVMSGFEASFKRWAPHRTTTVIGRKPKTDQKNILDFVALLDTPLVVILNYESWARNRNLLAWLINTQFDTVILDESHRVKEGNKQTAQGVKTVVLNSESVENILCMTGTPILNKPTEMFSNLEIIHPEMFNSKAQFSRNYCTFDYATNKETWGPGGEQRLARHISGMYIRRTLKDTGIKLPPQEQIIHEIEFDPEAYPLQNKMLNMLWDDAQIKLDSGEVASITGLLAMITRHRQATIWPGGIWMNIIQYDENGNVIYTDEVDKNGDLIPKTERVHVGSEYEESIKLDAAVDLYNELVESGTRVVVFSQFKEALKEFQRRVGDKAALFTGDTSSKDRDLIKNNFDASVGEEPKWDGILCHYQPGGVGLNLTAATAMIILDEEWNEGKANQAYDRIHRIGQENETQVHIFRMIAPEGTKPGDKGKYSMDQWLADMIALKAAMVNGFNMSVEQLRGAFV